jgi:hypothetical protein
MWLRILVTSTFLPFIWETFVKQCKVLAAWGYTTSSAHLEYYKGTEEGKFFGNYITSDQDFHILMFLKNGFLE